MRIMVKIETYHLFSVVMDIIVLNLVSSIIICMLSSDVRINTEISIPPIPDLYVLKSIFKSNYRYIVSVLKTVVLLYTL